MTATTGGSSLPADTVPDRLAAVLGAHRTLVGALDGLTEEQARGPAALPGWTRGHVLTHLADHARAQTRQAREALAGRQAEVYVGGRATRDASIEAGADRCAAELREDVTAACRELDETWSALRPADWGLRCGYRDGVLYDTLLSRWREVVIHMTDLALPGLDAPWPDDLCRHLLDYLAPRLPATARATVRATDAAASPHVEGPTASATGGSTVSVVVRGALADLAGWLAGRTSAGQLLVDGGELPALDPWP